MPNHSPVLSYWRNSLADATLLGISGKVLSDEGRAVPIFQSAFRQGQLKTEFIQKALKPEFKEMINGVLLAPIVLVPKRVHGTAWKGGVVVPLWIPARVLQNGVLAPMERVGPWIPRELLAPIAHSRDIPILGDLADFDAFMTQQPPPLNGNWEALWRWSQDLFEAVTGQRIESFVLDGYEIKKVPKGRDPLAYVVALGKDASLSGPGAALVRCYDQVRELPQLPHLLSGLERMAPSEPLPLMDGDAFLRATSGHLGQMSGKRSLTSSQRESLVHFCCLGHGQSLAVNGPPGTGKTTLLQSVIATLVVARAMEGGDPPLIMASSTNNQAVTNVIESFKSDSTDPMASRWLPGVESFGLYWPSEPKNSETRSKFIENLKEKQYQFVLPSEKDDFPTFLESLTYFTQAKVCFLENFEACLGLRPKNLQEAVHVLHQKVCSVAGMLCKLPASYLAAKKAQALDLRPQIRTLEAALKKAEAARADIRTKLQAWSDFQAQTPWWMGIFSFLPGVRAMKDQRDATFAVLHGLENTKGSMASRFETLEREAELECRRFMHELATIHAQEHERQGQINAYLDLLCALELPSDFVSPDQDTLDTGARYRAFLLASHYWEARWLLAREEAIKQPSKAGASQRPSTPEGWLGYLKGLAMLAPCSVATLYRLPAVLSSTRPRQYLWETLDLLIIDEAGQVSPEVGGAAFAFAKRAIVVGDTLQIEPVWNIPARVDQGNIAGAGFHVEAFPEAYRASEGNLMGVAQAVSPYRKHSERGGMFLSEHFRCVKSLIEYCNELAYRGRLDPRRKDAEVSGAFPVWGYAHVPGWSEKRNGSSLGNPLEAAAIAQWVLDHRAELEMLDKNKNLANAVAVVAPFSYQKELVLKELRSRELPEITVGTVHALQGAERPLVIFSPTCTARDPREFFFDRGVQMLNVAVSRAKDSFLVFGDMDIFDQEGKPDRPSTLMARYLFQSPENALEGYALPQPVGAVADMLAQAEPIASLEDHREALSESFEQAKERLIVVSPWITADALKADALPSKIASALRRGVSVLVYTDQFLNTEGTFGQSRTLKATAEEAAEMLVEVGAELRWTKNIHNKNLLVDDHTVILGSFNWLSARRSEADRYHRFDSSIRFRGPQAKEWIELFQREMEARVVSTSLREAVEVMMA